MLGPREAGRQSKDAANGKEKFRVVISAGERPRIPDALQQHQNELVVVIDIYGPLSATPKSTGWSAGVLQR